ncbi:MAG: hypothetical protein LBR06_06780 [Bacteroidales bacterium]|nr:hypothetical protein [Bacteroidales bacterium]
MMSVFSGCSKDDGGAESETSYLERNLWIKETMEVMYFWNRQIPKVDYTKQTDSKQYFNSLLYKDDRFSYITDDYDGLLSDLQGASTLSMGYDYTAYYISSGSQKVMMVVNYVYPDSPADRAGLKRGHIITAINNTELTASNFYELYSGTSYSVQLARMEDRHLSASGTSISMTAATIDPNPVVYSTVIATGQKKIGYLAYVSFVSGTNSKFLLELDRVFNSFKAEGITDLVIDLRYNPGGDTDAATRLASEIVPAAHNRDVFTYYEFNDIVSDYYKNNPDMFETLFMKLSSNINATGVYFLTTGNTASASELVIVGLRPYMDVVQIGEPTYGKCYGMTLFEQEGGNWGLLPIIFRYTNADGYTDFVDGLQPDFEVEDAFCVDELLNSEFIYCYPLGDTRDPMLEKAVEHITGIPASTKTTTKAVSKATRQHPPLPAAATLKSNLWIVP